MSESDSSSEIGTSASTSSPEIPRALRLKAIEGLTVLVDDLTSSIKLLSQTHEKMLEHNRHTVFSIQKLQEAIMKDNAVELNKEKTKK